MSPREATSLQAATLLAVLWPARAPGCPLEARVPVRTAPALPALAHGRSENTLGVLPGATFRRVVPSLAPSPVSLRKGSQGSRAPGGGTEGPLCTPRPASPLLPAVSLHWASWGRGRIATQQASPKKR